MSTPLITSPKTSFLLGAGLDVLHQESREWQETIAFWQDEIQFFDKLLKRADPLGEELQNLRQMLEALEKIHNNIFSQLQKDVRDHEKLLAQLERNEQGVSDWDYREKHRRLKSRMELLTSDFKTFKKVVFDYSKKLYP